MPALWTSGGVAVHGGGTARASKSSTIGYAKSKTAFWTANQAPLTRTHFETLCPDKRLSETLKTFLAIFEMVKGEINSRNNQLS
jgi:hypothetical protein